MVVIGPPRHATAATAPRATIAILMFDEERMSTKNIRPNSTLVVAVPRAPIGRLSAHLLQYFGVHGEFHIDEAGGGPWIKLVLGDGKAHATGLSRSQLLAGDPRLALVLAAVIDYNLSQSDARRADIEDMRAMFSLFRQATDAVTIGHRFESGAMFHQ